MAHIATLRTIPLFGSLDEFDLQKIAGWFDERSVSEGVELVGEGAAGYSFFVLVDGTAVVAAGDETLAQLGPGDFFGEGAIVGGGRRNASVSTTSPAQVLVMFGTEFRRLEQDYPAVAARIETVARERVAAEQG